MTTAMTGMTTVAMTTDWKPTGPNRTGPNQTGPNDRTQERTADRVVSVRVRIITTMLLVVLGAQLAAGVVVYLIERDRVHASVDASVDQEFRELDQLQRSGINPDTRRPFAAADEVITTFISRNVPGRGELLVGWWNGRAQNRSPGGPELTLDLGVNGSAHQLIAPLADAGRSGRISLPGVGEVLVSVQSVRLGGQTASLVVITSTDQAFAGLRDTMRTYAFVSAIALLVIAVGVTWQAGRLLAPLRDLRRSAEQVTARDLSARLSERGNDDITRLTRTYNDMLERLEAAFTAQRQFLDDAGHELKTPLTILQGHLELLDPQSPEEVAETRELLLDEVDRMGRLVGDLIMLAKARRPDFLRPTAVEVGALTRSVLAKAQGLGDRDWQLEGVAEVRASLDEQRMTQALLQLVDNAVKHTQVGDTIALGSRLDVHPAAPEGPDHDRAHHDRTALTGPTLTFWVRDTGPGIAPEQREAIWDRFVRGRVPEGDDGFGLGLSIVRAIALAASGQARVVDPGPEFTGVPGFDGGSRFELVIPLVSPTPHADDRTRLLPPMEDPWPRS